MERITLNNRYEIVDKVGGGGMAEVFHGYDTFLNRDVGIKILRDQYIQDADFIARFRQEACSAAKLMHPNIVNVYDVGVENDIYYIVMEYVVGKTIKEYINEEGALEPKVAVHYALGVAAALIQAHIHDVVHCDIKSQNILIDSTGTAKVTDFGIARAIGPLCQQTQENVIGSVHYLSPEQACGQPITPKSDLYSLGVVLFEMLTGKLPFEGTTPVAVALKHVQSVTPSLRSIVPDMPLFLEKIVAKALAKNPDKRYASAQEFLADLQHAEELLYSNESNKKVDNRDFISSDTPVPTEGVNDQTMIISKAEMIDGIANYKPPKEQQEIVEPPKKSNKKFLILVVCGILALLGIVYGVLEYSKMVVTVPDLKGKTIVEAEEILDKSHLTYILSEEYSEDVPAGQVSSQDPPANSKVKEGRKILLVISKGVEQGVAPNLVGKNLTVAKQLLKSAKLKLGTVTVRYAAGKPMDSVLEQSVRAKTKVDANTKINLIVNISDGQTVVPSVSGMTLDAAKALLSEAGLQLGTVTEKPDASAKNNVLTTDPDIGSVVGKSTVVNVTVSTGDPSKKDEKADKNALDSGSAKIVEFVVPSGQDRNEVKLVLINEKGTSTVYTGLARPGVRLRQQVEIAGPTRVQFYANGTLVEDRKI
ncbi:Serine/threonine-protein kinase PrkC [bioreactor metagenome]|jgi:Serine/threonine protein kinase|uniref:Serine/threonine-protein kinase PrkC n=1 Tax=bioreactor metagenome TaxID=1076179 RepID=A0A644V4H0_9ZZZZ|nr:Stk1 family PASTA domain-containing Ser/Thr kinase [Acidaminococcaceae bacterium]